MHVQHTDFLSLYQTGSGRAIWALNQVIPAAKAQDAPQVANLAEEALALAKKALDLEVRFRSQQSQPTHGPQATSLDATVDRTLSALVNAIGSALVVYQGKSSAPARAAETLERELLPRGVYAVTSLPYVEEHETIGRLLARLEKGGDLAEHVKTLDLEPHVERLREVNTAFGKELFRETHGPTFDEVRAAKAAVQGALHRVVAAALGRFVADDDATLGQRTAVLGPLLAQQQAIGAALKGRRFSAPDVDPATGTEISEAPPAA
jgi:hypothetical protein